MYLWLNTCDFDEAIESVCLFNSFFNFRLFAEFLTFSDFFCSKSDSKSFILFLWVLSVILRILFLCTNNFKLFFVKIKMCQSTPWNTLKWSYIIATDLWTFTRPWYHGLWIPGQTELLENALKRIEWAKTIYLYYFQGDVGNVIRIELEDINKLF